MEFEEYHAAILGAANDSLNQIVGKSPDLCPNLHIHQRFCDRGDHLTIATFSYILGAVVIGKVLNPPLTLSLARVGSG
jgi:hypothetical protein